jgi:hypothetical protein
MRGGAGATYVASLSVAGNMAAMWKDQFLQYLKQSTVAKPLIEQALALKQQHLPQRIYKYRKDDVAGYARKNLASNTIWLATPDTYNDPYDCFLQFSAPNMAAAFERGLIDAFISGYQLDISPDNVTKAKQSLTPLQTFLQNITSEGKGGSHPKQIAEHISKAIPGYINSTKEFLQALRVIAQVCSFSAIHDSILMWSHYADNHKGFCVEYDLEKLDPNDGFLKNLYPVAYSNELGDMTPWAEKLVSGGAGDLATDYLLLGVIQKFTGWAYEQEWRYIRFQEPPNQDRNRSMSLPSRVFLGAKAQSSTTEAILAICEEKNIPVWHMRMSSDRYELVANSVCA